MLDDSLVLVDAFPGSFLTQHPPHFCTPDLLHAQQSRQEIAGYVAASDALRGWQSRLVEGTGTLQSLVHLTWFLGAGILDVVLGLFGFDAARAHFWWSCGIGEDVGGAW